ITSAILIIAPLGNLAYDVLYKCPDLNAPICPNPPVVAFLSTYWYLGILGLLLVIPSWLWALRYRSRLAEQSAIWDRNVLRLLDISDNRFNYSHVYARDEHLDHITQVNKDVYSYYSKHAWPVSSNGSLEINGKTIPISEKIPSAHITVLATSETGVTLEKVEL